MENASNALIMAGGILLAIMIVTFGIILVSIFGSFTKEQQDEMSKTSIMQFNNQFTIYEAKQNTVHDIVSVIYLAKDINASNDGISLTVKVTGDASAVNQDSLEADLKQLLQNGYDNKGQPKHYYDCEVKFNAERVNQVIFKQR